MQNIVVRSSETVTSTVSNTASAETTAALRKGPAIPASRAPSAIVLATSSPLRNPPLATMGKCGAPWRTIWMDSAVGIPQSLKVVATRRRVSVSARCISTWLQLVPPAPATSMAAIPASASRRASSCEKPQPTSFATTGTSSFLHTASTLSSSPAKLVLPSGWSASCKALKWRNKALASTISTARRQ